MAELGYDGKVAIITGAGGGLGRSHALELAQRGALVVVNDLGGSVDGQGGSHTAAQQVVDEIKAAGGEATANYDSVATPEGAKAIVANGARHVPTGRHRDQQRRLPDATPRSRTWTPKSWSPSSTSISRAAST